MSYPESSTSSKQYPLNYRSPSSRPINVYAGPLSGPPNTHDLAGRGCLYPNSIPDLQKYNWACHLTRLVDWHMHRLSKDWITVEDSFTNLPISNSPWINHKSVPKDYTSHPLIGATLSLFKLTCKSLTIAPSPGPMTPLENNPEFPPGLSLKDPNLNAHTTHARAHSFFHSASFLSYPTLSATLSDFNIPFYKYLQLRHFFNMPKHTSLWHE